MKSLEKTWKDESGQGLVEYALIVALVAIGLIALVFILRNSDGRLLQKTADSLNTPSAANPAGQP